MEMHYIVQLVSIFVGSVGFALLFNVRTPKLFGCAFGGFLAWGFYLCLGFVVENEVARYFLASMFLTVYAEIMARVRKSPDTIYIICAAIPLFPGGFLYNAMHSAVEGNRDEFLTAMLHTLLLAAAIALGVLCMVTVMNIIFAVIKQVKHRVAAK